MTSDVPCSPVVGTRESGLPFGAYLCQHFSLAWADLFAKMGRLSTAVDPGGPGGGIDWVVRFVPMEASRGCQRPLMKRVCHMWLALSSFVFHPCSLEGRSERPIQSSLPPGLPTRLNSALPPLYAPTFPYITPRYGPDREQMPNTRLRNPKSFNLQLNSFLSPFANRNRHRVVSVIQFCLATFTNLGWAVCAHNSLSRGKKIRQEKV